MSNYKGIFPGTFTMGNVVCGFLAILSSFEGNITTACWLIILAAFLDALDGKVARLSGSSSRFGVELDSLADFLSFGVAPAVVVYAIKLNDLGKWGWLVSVVYIMAAAYRLARFNLLAETEEKKDFVGLAVPVPAVVIVSYIIFCFDLWGELQYDRILVSMIILFAFLMVSQVRYDALPENFGSRENRIKLIALIIASAAILFSPRLLLFPLGAAYILFGIVRELVRLFGKSIEKVTGRPYPRRRNDRNNQDE
ncbi:MAG: CDP-diacylglycerol--serine O-phosphatidyltransferase [candidate division Zixibacteria bacterium]|nr:CDP-diacylglycerol--serine O-phosphatidyltransferase [candidate division Zixibacteria bacterium]MDH4034465.1 CDP-diacylglycerol--serine O-phosphatidyltransferase [candidate division Zixibacteria bacterium]